MFEKDFNQLDDDYITLHTNYILDNDKGSYFNSIKKLAQKGQLYAIQDYYTLKDKNENDLIIDCYSEKLLDKKELNFEEYWTLYLYLKNRRDETAMQTEYRVYLSEYKRKLLLTKTFNKTLEKGRKDMLSCYFSDKYRHAIISERLSQISRTAKADKIYVLANTSAKESLKKVYSHMPKNNIIKFLSFCYIKRNKPENLNYCLEKLNEIASRPIKSEEENQ